MRVMRWTIVAIEASIGALLGAPAAHADAGPWGVRLELKAESHNTAMTAPIVGPFVGVSRAVGAVDALLQPKVWAAVGYQTAISEAAGPAGELGVSLSYYGQARRDGLGLALDAGLAALRLHQRHDQEELLAIALLAEPAVVWTYGRVTVLAGLRLKAIVYERLTGVSRPEQPTELPTGPRELERGPKIGLRVGF